jgi:hypothetical protein
MKFNEIIIEALDEEIIDEWSTTDAGIKKILVGKGYTFLGKGVDQSAYLEPSTGMVLKIFGTQASSHSTSGAVTHTKDHKMFFVWAQYCMANANNPFLPKFGGFESFIFDNKTYLQIRQEKLTSFKMLGDAIEIIADSDSVSRPSKGSILQATKSEVEQDRWSGKAALQMLQKFEKDLGTQGLELLLKTMSDLVQIARQKQYTWDMHDGNIMMRGKIPVIVDPWVVR